MDVNSSAVAAAHFAEYDRLLSEYQMCAVQCQIGIDQLAAAERELRAVAARLDSQAPDVNREIDSIQTKLLDGQIERTLWGIDSLSKRECEVFELIGNGLTTQEIASALHLATSTVETYRERLKHKLKLSSGSALTRQAVLWSVSRAS